MINKRMLYVFISLIVVMLCFSSSTMAWLSMNRLVWSKSQKMTIQAVSDVMTIDCYAIRYDGSLGAVCYKIGDDPNAGEVLDVEMTEFDRIFRDRTVNTPLIYVIELANVPDNANNVITVKVPCFQKYIKVDNNYTNNHVASENDTSYSIQKYISNIISVKVGCSGAIPELTPTLAQRVENNVTLFNTQRAYFKNVNSGDRVGQFATATKDNGTYTYSKTTSVQVRLTQSEYHSSLYTIPNEAESTGNHLMLYVQFDYDDDLMDAYINLIHDDSDEDIDFADDLGVIQVLVGTGDN